MSVDASWPNPAESHRPEAGSPEVPAPPQERHRTARRWHRWIWRALSVPVFVKVLGIGLVVGTVFGAVTLLQVRASISRGLQQMLEQRTRSLASGLAANLERPLSVGDSFSVAEKLRRTHRMFSDIRYVVVWDAEGSVVGSTFEKGVPADLRRLYEESISAGSAAAVAQDADARHAANHESFAVFDATCTRRRRTAAWRSTTSIMDRSRRAGCRSRSN